MEKWKRVISMGSMILICFKALKLLNSRKIMRKLNKLRMLLFYNIRSLKYKVFSFTQAVNCNNCERLVNNRHYEWDGNYFTKKYNGKQKYHYSTSQTAAGLLCLHFLF